MSTTNKFLQRQKKLKKSKSNSSMAIFERKSFNIRETPSLYKRITLPWIKSIHVKNFEIGGEILSKYEDIKMSFTSKVVSSIKNTLHVIAYPGHISSSIKTLRDLRKNHIPLLEKMLEMTLSSIKQKYNLDKNEISVFLYYIPKCHQLRVHFMYNTGKDPELGRALYLEDVIDNLKSDDEYYKNASINIKAGELFNNLLKEKKKRKSYKSMSNKRWRL